MKTIVMFVLDSEPLVSVPVRVQGTSDTFVTDEEGKVELSLDLGEHTFEVEIGEDWRERTVQRQGHAPLFVVNMAEPSRPNVSKLNTLQIDLANLVGDRYVFETVLGRGGMGVVVKAVDRMLNRPVAIKMLSDELRENEEAQQIFLVEARNLATLSHPNLVAIHDILNVGGRVLMVFEYVLGENVEKKLKKNGALDQREVLRIAIQLTRCVSYLHEHDLIHRDLKPANIIMQADGTLKLIDFGLARSLNDLYVRGTRVRGTPAYMAPEQIQGIHLTTATDLYQIGISMYEMLTGRLPFATGDMAYAHVHLEPPPLAERIPNIDPGLEQLVMRCLSKSPKHRPASSEALLEALQSVYARLANAESDEDDYVLDPTDPSLLPPRTRTQSQPGLDHRSSGIHEAMVPFEPEVDQGADWVAYAVLAVGVVALVVAGALLLQRGSDEELVVETTAAAAAESVEAPPSVPLEVEEVEPDGLPAVAAASGIVSLGIATATGMATGQAAAAMPVEEAPAAVRQPAPSRTPRPPAARKPVAAPATKTTSQGSKRESDTVERLGSKEEKASPSLLSVEKSGSKSLLPVSE